MGLFVKGRCPTCSWEISPKVWRRELEDPGVVGLLFQSSGDRNLSCVGPLREPSDLEAREPGLFNTIAARLVAAVGLWVRWRWIPLREVLNALPVHDMGNGMWVENYERRGRRPGTRVAYDYDLVDALGHEVSSRTVETVATREVHTYAW